MLTSISLLLLPFLALVNEIHYSSCILIRVLSMKIPSFQNYLHRHAAAYTHSKAWNIFYGHWRRFSQINWEHFEGVYHFPTQIQHLKTQWDFPAFKWTVEFLCDVNRRQPTHNLICLFREGPIKLNLQIRFRVALSRNGQWKRFTIYWFTSISFYSYFWSGSYAKE